MISASNMLIPSLLPFICMRLRNLVILMTKRANICDLWINTHGAGITQRTCGQNLSQHGSHSRVRWLDMSAERAEKRSKRDERAVRIPSVIEYDRYWQPEDCSRVPQGMTMINSIAAVMAAMSLGASAFAKTRPHDAHRHRVTQPQQAFRRWSQALQLLWDPMAIGGRRVSGCWTRVRVGSTAATAVVDLRSASAPLKEDPLISSRIPGSRRKNGLREASP